MSINLSIPQKEAALKPRITVIGVGGAGTNAVNNMIQSNLEGVEFVATNTDSQALAQSRAERQIQLGTNITQGLGAGSRPDIGRAAAEEALDEILENLSGSHMVFITAGMGGGTGTGAGPVIARAARDQGILTVGVVTKPFHFEGAHRMRIAEQGIEEMQQFVDTLIIIPNQNLFRVATEKTTFADAFQMADDVLYSGVRGVTDLMVMPGLINLDFADIRSVMSEMGKAMMGTGTAEGEHRAIEAAEAAISNPLLDDVSMKGARGVLINITGGGDMTLYEVDECANRVREEVDPDANIIFGSTFDDQLEGQMRVSVVATGIDVAEGVQPRPAPLTVVASRGPALANTATPNQGVEGGFTVARPAAPAMGPAMKAPAPQPAPQPAAPPTPQPVAHPAPRPAAQAAPRPAAQPAAPKPFIPPAPAMPGQSAQRDGDRRPDPFAEAAMTNAGKTSARPGERHRRGPSLFERVTGTGRARVAAPAREPAAPAPTEKRIEPSLSASTPVTAAPAIAKEAETGMLGTGEQVVAQPLQETGAIRKTEEIRDTGDIHTGDIQESEEIRETAEVPTPHTPVTPIQEEAPGETEEAPGLSQPRLDGLESARQPVPSPKKDSPANDEDLLDIPAFLRRQAN